MHLLSLKMVPPVARNRVSEENVGATVVTVNNSGVCTFRHVTIRCHWTGTDQSKVKQSKAEMVTDQRMHN